MDDKSTQNIPQNEINALARLLLPKIQEYFESDAGKEEFKQWKARNAAAKKNK